MLKYRLLFGTLMTLFFIGVTLLGGWLDGSFAGACAEPVLPIKGTVLCVFIALLAIPAQTEMSSLLGRTGITIFRPIVIPASILLATSWYWRQFYPAQIEFHLYYLLFVSAILLLLLFLYQSLRFGNAGTAVNCAGNFFSCFYLGFLSSFVLGIRIDFGLWTTLMFIFTIKSSDIGAYALGRLFGRHKFSPKISPSKTWEGIAGAVIFAAIVAVIFSKCCGIMSWWSAAIFGAVFAVLGQLGDLAESMIKRDAEQKDSANSVPGFGGILDIIDSPLATAPLAYIFFTLAVH